MASIAPQEELDRIWPDERVTMVLVTHDLEEAVALADRVVVLPRGRGGRPRLIEAGLPRPYPRSEAGFVAMRRRSMREIGLR